MVIFRYKASAIGILIGISVALLSLFYADFMRQLSHMEDNDRIRVAYKYQYGFSVQTESEETYEELSNILRRIDMTIIAEDVSLYVNSKYTEHLCRVVVNQSEPLKYNLISGRYPTVEELKLGEPIVILGSELRKNTFLTGGEEYISICGEKYRVIGYCSGKKTTVTNYSVILFAECLGEQTERDFWQAGNTYTQTYTLNSDTAGVQDEYAKIEKQLEDAGFSVGGLFRYSTDFNGGQYQESYVKLSYLICFFSIFVSVIVIQFWLFQRRYELAVRRIYGYSKIKLYLYIIEELMKWLFMALVISMTLYGIIAFVYYLNYEIWLPGIIIPLLKSFFMSVVIVVFMTIVTTWNTFRGSSLSTYRGR